jgi:molybdenum cofactor biosynthesis enzyme MoaA
MNVDNNVFRNLYVDLTERCNMKCNFCYNPRRINVDLDYDYFAEVCSRLPDTVNWRFLGGEPTLAVRFFDYLDVAIRHKHTVYFASNGAMYNDKKFIGELALRSGKVSVGLSMDGGSVDNGIYEIINNRACLAQKLNALDNLRRHGIGRVCLSAIIVRGVNERVIGELIDVATRYSDVVRYLHFRSAAMIGRWVNTKPYDLAELKSLVRPYFEDDAFVASCVRELNCNGGDGECCFRFRPTRRLQISLIEFASERATLCHGRGKLLPQGFRIEPFFLNMRNAG